MNDCGHGHVFRAGHKAHCGGPGLCRDCDADLAAYAAGGDTGPIAGQFRAELEAEIQQMCDRARANT